MRSSVSAKRKKSLELCRSLPGTTEDTKWGADLCFSIGAKMYAVFSEDGSDATFTCKVPPEDFGALTSVEGIRPAKYLAKHHWIHIDDEKVLPASALAELLRGSYELVRAALPKKLQAQIAEAKRAPKRSTGKDEKRAR